MLVPEKFGGLYLNLASGRLCFLNEERAGKSKFELIKRTQKNHHHREFGFGVDTNNCLFESTKDFWAPL